VRLLNTHFDPEQPYWLDYLPFIRQLNGHQFPACERLNSLLPEGLNSHGGHMIRFTPSTGLDDLAYEQRIYSSGMISTRPDNWHDLFNAMVWMRFPHIKTAMNALHHRAWGQSSKGSRGQLRDALTLFDECGVIVFSQHEELLTALSNRQWPTAFQQLKSRWDQDFPLVIIGHAMLEKYLSPYKSMTAKALLIQITPPSGNMSRDDLLAFLDLEIADQLLAGRLLTKPACLAPLPLAGVPGWWPDSEQDDQFYDDTQVFRPPAADLKPAPVSRLKHYSG